MGDLIETTKDRLEERAGFAFANGDVRLGHLLNEAASLLQQPRLPDGWNLYSGTGEGGQYIGVWHEGHDINARVYDYQSDRQAEALRLLLSAFLPSTKPEAEKKETLVEAFKSERRSGAWASRDLSNSDFIWLLRKLDERL